MILVSSTVTLNGWAYNGILRSLVSLQGFFIVMVRMAISKTSPLEYAIATANRYIELKPLARILESTRQAKEC